jgi:hypothetical protein
MSLELISINTEDKIKKDTDLSPYESTYKDSQWLAYI